MFPLEIKSIYIYSVITTIAAVTVLQLLTNRSSNYMNMCCLKILSGN